MPQKLFILGLPGSGKSTIARYIVDYIERNYPAWSATSLCDYDILYAMFQSDQAQKLFSPREHKGFYVKNTIVYNLALKQLERSIEHTEYPENTLLIIEFARSNYVHAFSNFSQAFLQDVFVLILDVDINIGIKRVRNRIRHPRSSDDHFVPKHTFEAYNQKDNTQYLSSVAQQLMNQYGINSQRIKIINNRGSKRHFWKPLHSIIKKIWFYASRMKISSLMEAFESIPGKL